MSRFPLAIVCLLVTAACGTGPVDESVQGAFEPVRGSSPFDPAQVARGGQLAAIGNCAVCHTRPGGKPYAGGLAIETPFGTIFSTNITPDPDTGIGKWSGADFMRAMHDGLDRAGRHLYPAFPYDHFTKVTDADVNVIYAFVMTREPVRAITPSNKLAFPFNVRPFLTAWKALYFEKGVFRPDAARSEEWNRGAYLVEGLAHCSACHTPRNALGAEDKQRKFAGGEAQGWHGPAMNAASPAPKPWSADQIFNYLRNGRDDLHGIAAGPMVQVVHNLSQVPESDVRAIGHYIESLSGPRSAELRNTPKEAEAPRIRSAAAANAGNQETRGGVSRANDGAAVFAGACASCHDPSKTTMKTVPLALTTSVNAPDPRNLIHVILNGIWPQAGEPGALMPGFAAELTDKQVAALVAYLRAHFSTRPAWDDAPESVREISRQMDEK